MRRQEKDPELPADDDLHRFVLQTFATTGRSPTLEHIQDRFGLPSVDDADRRVSELERRGVIHRNPGDRLITHAYPFSNDTTAHRVRLTGGAEVYAMCAIDALGMPFMLRKDAEIISACAQCGQDVHIYVRDGRVATYAPADVAVWLGEMSAGCVAATDLCPDLNFFCSPTCIDAWTSAHPEKHGERLNFDEALTRGRQVFEGLMYGPDECCSDGP